MIENARSSYLETSNSQVSFQIIIDEVDYSDYYNTSKLKVRVEAWCWDEVTRDYAGICTVQVGSHDPVSNEWSAGEKPLSYKSDTVLLELSDESAVTVEHKQDGSLTLEVWATVTFWSGGSTVISSEWQGYDVELTKLTGIPQLGISGSAKSSRSIVVRLTASQTSNRWWYSIDNGETWVEYAQGTEGTETTVTVEGLMPRRRYAVKGCARTTGGTDFYSNTYYIKTNGSTASFDVSNHISIFSPTAMDFSTNGLGSLSDAISCVVTEERNGAYELQLEYPVNGINYSYLRYRYIIVANANPYDDPQPFRIYAISKPIDGKVTINAAHISYDLSGWSVRPFYSSKYLWQTLTDMTTHIDGVVDYPFSVGTDLMTNEEEKVLETKYPRSVRSIIGEGTDSIIGLWNCEMEFKEYSVYFLKSRGSDNGVVIRYSKNMTNFTLNGNSDNVYTRVRPYWYKELKEDATWEERQQGGLVETNPPLLVPNPNATSYLDQYIEDIKQLSESASTLNTNIEALRGFIDRYNAGTLDTAALAAMLDISEETLIEELDKYPEGSLLDLDTIVNWTEPEGYPHRTMVLDMSSEVWKELYYVEKNDEWKEQDKKPTPNELKTRFAENLMSGMYPMFNPVASITVSFVNVYDSKEYQDHGLQDLEKIRLCDTVTVIFPTLLGEDDYTDENGTMVKMKCVKTTYNVLAKKYDSLELGMIQKDLASTISGQSGAISSSTASINHASLNNGESSSSGGTGGNVGYVVLDYSRDPGKLLSMNTKTATGAGNVWKVDTAGFSHSSTGVNGKYEVAISQSGSINTNSIRTNGFDGSILKPDSVSKGVISSEYDKYINGEIKKEAKNISEVSSFSNTQEKNIHKEMFTDGILVGKTKITKTSDGIDIIICN
jgi:phage minor structural protein